MAFVNYNKHCYVDFFMYLRSKDKNIEPLQDLFKTPKKKINYSFEQMEDLKAMNIIIDNLKLSQKLWLLRTFMGHSYRAVIKVSSKNIEIVGLGCYDFVEDEDQEGNVLAG